MPIDFSFLEGGASQNENTSQNSDTANVTIRVDVDSLLLCDGDYIDQPFKAGALTKIQLPIGQHILEFLSEENPDVKVEKIVDFQEAGKSYLVIVNELKAAAAETADTCVIPEGVEALRSKKEFMKYYKGESRVILPSSLKILGDHIGDTIFGDDNYSTREDRRYEFEQLLKEQEFDEAAKLEKFLTKLEKEKVDIRHIDISKCTKLESIGEGTFEYCYYLSSVILPNSLREIQKSAFSNCQELKEIVIPENVNIIGSSAFASCKRLNKIHFEKPNCVKFGSAAFKGCSSLKSITIPESVTNIGSKAFEGCSSLESITIPNSVTEIGESAFEGCSSLKSITIPESVTEIGEHAFESCSSLKSITIPESVTKIGSEAFKSCSSLERVTIPESVTVIRSKTFYSCRSLKDITIPKSVMVIGYEAFKSCTSLKSIIIPNSVTEIENDAFSGCKSLQSITIPNSVTVIGERAFESCSSLERVHFEKPRGVTFKKGAFSYCKALKSFNAPTEPIDAFKECKNLRLK